MKTVMTVVVSLFLCTAFAFSSDMFAELNDGHITKYSGVSGGRYLLPDDWLNPCGPNSDEDDEWYNGLAFYPDY